MGTREAVGLGNLERSNLLLAAQPFEQSGLQIEIACVAGAGRLAAARAVAVMETRGFSGGCVLYGAA